MSNSSHNDSDSTTRLDERKKVKWYRSTFYNITILGLCNLSAPGIWGAMNSLGAGGAQRPYLVNTANALTFCLMVVSCWLSSALVRVIGIKGALIFGTLGYAPYAAGLYTNNRFGTEWLVILGAALCGISAGVFWMAEAAIAIAYPEPWNRGKALGFWLTFRVSGQILGGAINLGLNTDRDQAGKVSYTVFLIFIALQCLGPAVALCLTPPDKVERQDGKKVDLSILNNPWFEIKQTTRLFFTKKFLLIVLFIGQAVFAEAVFFTYLSCSFLSGIVAVIGGNILGAGFGSGFAVFLFLLLGFQLNYLFLYFIIQNLSESKEEIIRYSALLRGTESAWQAVSYGLEAVPVMAHVGGVYLNFALWGLAIFPAWLVLRHFGAAGENGSGQGPYNTTPASDGDVETVKEAPAGTEKAV
ncbi:hypothetical protein ACCO45_007628 [Purpureocillium lilacinum]|uniref:Uncharacterized protein n=1 Tax=Purpureocillium lilacinum TaxID=33203 RepID=A0ACC4DNZ1_PURLI